MKQFRLGMSQDVRDLIIHLPPSLKKKVKTALHEIAINPYQAKELQDDLAGLRSYRISQSRIIFRIRHTMIEVIAFGPRKDIYERASTELYRRSGHDPEQT